MPVLFERAPAKINLTLRIVRRRDDGFHELESLVCFSAAGDLLTFEPGGELSLSTDGPYAQDCGPAESNLVVKAAQQLAAHVPGLASGRFRLSKNLPAAAGIGGGSSDAAAALRLLARANGLLPDDARVEEAARATGSDVPVCLAARGRMMRGTGGVLGPLLKLPPLFAVLVNPRVPLETKAVFARLGLAPGEDYAFAPHPAVTDAMPLPALLALAAKTGNDLEDPASVLESRIVDVLSVLGAARGCRLARMSGSGATCFGLFETRTGASRAAAAIRRDRPGWWVKACILR
ncbi:MAG: 4-(cytidine 5'-diphospho)-2-C-methyl-D-erythritol kinase [Beijerinckiaceae bacterium]